MRHFPSTIRAGVTFDALLTLREYQAPVWSLSVVLRGPSAIDFESVAEGSEHRLRVSATDTAKWGAGAYEFSVRATDGTEVVEIQGGMAVVKPDLSTLSAGADVRSHVQIVLANIEAVIEKRASRDQERYLINNRELWRTPIGDLLKLRDRYRGELRRMQAAQGGTLFNRQVRVRF